MTLHDLLEYLSSNPFWIIAYFSLIPFTALLAGWLGSGEGHLSPWNYLYSALIYLVAVPGIFAVTLSIYLFLFERRSIMDIGVFTQILPIFSMVGTFVLIRRNVSFDDVPGFDKISGLLMIIAATLTLMWVADRTHIIFFSYMPFYYALIIFILLLVVIRFGWSKLVRKGSLP